MKTTTYEYFVLTNRMTSERIEFPCTVTMYDVVKHINKNMSYDESYVWRVSLVTINPEIEVVICQAFVLHGNTAIYGRTENA